MFTIPETAWRAGLRRRIGNVFYSINAGHALGGLTAAVFILVALTVPRRCRRS